MNRHRAFTTTLGLAVSALLLSGCGGLSDDDREAASDAALEAVGSGRVTEVDEGDDDETAAYIVEVALDDGTDVDVELDDNFGVLNQAEIDNQLGAGAAPSDAPSESPSESPSADAGGVTTESPAPGDDAVDDGNQRNVDDDTPLQGRIKQQAERAALDEVGGGRVTESTYADPDERHVYEVEIELRNNDDDDLTVELDRNFNVVRVDR